MLQIDNHKEYALSDIIPYLLQFPEVYQLAEQSGERYQKIEDIAWQLLYNLDYKNANGVWLDYIGRKVGQDRIYTPKPQNAFTFGGVREEGFGQGKFKGTASVKSTKVARSDSSFRNAIQAKIIQNNTDTSLDELISACKLLFNASVVRVAEEYPAGISDIRMYGSSLLETTDAQAIIKNALGAGISLHKVTFHKFYNLFKNNAFITYNKIIPETDNFELSFTLTPDISPSETFAIFSQNTSFANEYASAECYYDPIEGIVFKTSANLYNDNNNRNTYYVDENGSQYVDGSGDVVLTGGTLTINEPTSVMIQREGNVWSLYINGALVDYEESPHNMIVGEDVKLYLGIANRYFYNQGSIYNLNLINKTTNEVLINDPLKNKTIGINNGVRFL